MLNLFHLAVTAFQHIAPPWLIIPKQVRDDDKLIA
jgi:hypothetical protein